MIPVLAFGASGALLIAFLAFKAIENSRGARFAPAFRSRADARLHALMEKAQAFRITDEHKRVVRLTARYVAHQAVVKVLEIVRKVEARLAHAADVIRGKRVMVAHVGSPSSPFLETIVEHKKSQVRKASRRARKNPVMDAVQDAADALSTPIPQPE